jgi:hypothetical protein
LQQLDILHYVRFGASLLSYALSMGSQVHGDFIVCHGE